LRLTLKQNYFHPPDLQKRAENAEANLNELEDTANKNLREAEVLEEEASERINEAMGKEDKIYKTLQISKVRQNLT
jgi:hypothetical protein